MTHKPDAKDVATKLLNMKIDDWIEACKEIDSLKSRLEMEKEHAIWEKTSLCSIVKENESLRSDLATSQARCGKLEEALSILVQAKTVKEWNGDTDYYRKLKEQGCTAPPAGDKDKGE